MAETEDALKTLNPSSHRFRVIDRFNFNVPGILNSIRKSFDRLAGRHKAAGEPSKPELTGAPARLRVKTYSGESGYVYQYVYRGQRTIESGTGFVFSVSKDRLEWRPLEIVVEHGAVQEWQRSDGPALKANEMYGVAKLALFEFLDRADAWTHEGAVRVKAQEIERHLGSLGLL